MTTRPRLSSLPFPSGRRKGRIRALLLGGALATGCAAQKGYAPVNGMQVYYELHGSSGDPGTPLVLLHGGGSTFETSFADVLPALSRGRRVIVYDRQGHGRTADVDRPFSFHQSAEDAVALLRQLGFSRADFMGFSNGGQIAIQIALSHPEVVRRLVIESAMFSREGADAAFWAGFDRVRLEDMPGELREAYLQVAPRPGDLPTMFRKSVDQMRSFEGWTPEQIRSIRAPTLVLLGDRDVVRPEHGVALYPLLPESQLAILPNTDHRAICHPPAWLPAYIAAFLDAPVK
ncbi:MAG TPA: alpha/beta hydrolase [Myxococcaceae bacterium]|nr:alpha/beta hydrolase [Myxococcaceae bacterium]